MQKKNILKISRGNEEWSLENFQFKQTSGADSIRRWSSLFFFFFARSQAWFIQVKGASDLET